MSNFEQRAKGDNTGALRKLGRSLMENFPSRPLATHGDHVPSDYKAVELTEERTVFSSFADLGHIVFESFPSGTLATHGDHVPSSFHMPEAAVEV